jgi:hypothetical protein
MLEEKNIKLDKSVIIGRVVSIQKNNISLNEAYIADEICIKIDPEDGKKLSMEKILT